MKTIKRQKRSASDRAFDAINVTVLGLLTLAILYPLYYVLLASVTDPYVVNTGRLLLYPTPEDWFPDGYRRIFEYAPIWSGYRNTFLYTGLGTLIAIVVTVPAGYVLSRRDLAGGRALMLLFAFTMFFQGGMIPSYLLIRNIGIFNTMWAIVLPPAVSVWNLIVCRTFFESSIPGELREAAGIDGCNDFVFFFRIVLPLSSTIIAVMVLFYATAMWNSFFPALIYLMDDDKMPLQMVLRNLILINQVTSISGSAGDMIWRQRLAEQLKYGVIVVAALPLLVVYPFVQKYFAKGVMIGAIKG